MVERGRLIEIIGTTVTGKTTFAEELGRVLGATVLLETAEGNPYMAHAHHGGKLSWDNQVWFLQKYVERLSTATSLVKDGKIAIIDSGLPTYILHSKLILTPEQNVRYDDLAAQLTHDLAVPDLTLYLRDSTKFLMDRLKARHKPYDDASTKFVSDLTRLHDEWVATATTPVMPIRSRDLEHAGLKLDIMHTIVFTIRPHAVAVL